MLLRIVAELAVLSAWPEGAAKGAGELGKVLQALVSRFRRCRGRPHIDSQMSGDPQFNNMPLISAFLKFFSRVYLGPQPMAEEKLPEGVLELVPADVQSKMRELCVGYFHSASKTLVKGQVVGTSSSHLPPACVDVRNCSNKTNATTKRTSNPARSSKTANTRTRR